MKELTTFVLGAVVGAAALWHFYAAQKIEDGDTAKAQAVQAQKDRDDAMTSLNASQKSVDELKKNLAEKTQELSAAVSARGDLEKIKTVLDSQLADKDAQIGRLTTEADKLREAQITSSTLIATPKQEKPMAPAPTENPEADEAKAKKQKIEELRVALRDVLNLKPTIRINTNSGVSVTTYPKYWDKPETDPIISKADASMFDARTIRDQIQNLLGAADHPY